MYRTLVVSFSKLTELFGRTDRSEPTGQSISNLSLRLAPSFLANLKKQRWIWCFCLSFQLLQCNFCKSIFTLSVVCVLFVLIHLKDFKFWRQNHDNNCCYVVHLCWKSPLEPMANRQRSSIEAPSVAPFSAKNAIQMSNQNKHKNEKIKVRKLKREKH